MLTASTLSKAVGISIDEATKWVEPLNAAMNKYSIVTPLRICHFLAQTGHESNSFTQLAEGLNYKSTALLSLFPSRITKEQANLYGRTTEHKANQEMIANIIYANRNGNGDVASGDGYKFRGRGLIQITGRTNYKNVGYESNPDGLLLPAGAAMSAADWWNQHNLNVLADANNIDRITRVINGGTNGLNDRTQRLAQAKKVLMNV